jgi:hypothetical protein
VTFTILMWPDAHPKHCKRIFPTCRPFRSLGDVNKMIDALLSGRFGQRYRLMKYTVEAWS